MQDSPQSQSGPIRPLKRGKACLTCRFLKIKCDGVRPVCGPCLRHPKDDPCEYSDGPGRSRTRALEEKIARLEARIQELEDPEMATPSIMLHQPYSDQQPSSSGLQLSLPSPSNSAFTSPDAQAFTPLSPYPLASPSVTTPSPIGHISLSSPLDAKPVLPEYEELPPALTLELLNTFARHTTEIGFFLNVPRFQASVLLPFQLGDARRPAPALIRSVFLWGACLSEHQRNREADFLSLALKDTATSLGSSHPDRVIHTIQAEVLLAYYFFRSGHVLETKVHAASAASLALACGLHRLRSRTSTPPPADESDYLPDVKATMDEGERINAFWAVVTMYKTMSVAFGSPRDVCGMFEAPGLSIDTPWPLDMDVYKEGILPSPGPGNTINTFLSQMKRESSDASSSRVSYAALVAKSTVLYHRATYFAGQYTPNSSQSQSFFSAYEFLLRAIDDLRVSIPSIPDLDPSSPTARTFNLVLALLYGALIKLHGMFSNSDVNSRQRWIAAARAMLSVSDPATGNAHPIMGTLISQSCQVLIAQLDFYQLRGSQWPPTPTGADEPTEADVTNELQQGLQFLSQYPRESARLSKSSQFRKVLYQMMVSSMVYPQDELSVSAKIEEPAPMSWYQQPVMGDLDLYDSDYWTSTTTTTTTPDYTIPIIPLMA